MRERRKGDGSVRRNEICLGPQKGDIAVKKDISAL